MIEVRKTRKAASRNRWLGMALLVAMLLVAGTAYGRNLTITPAGTGTGTVTSSPTGISCGTTCVFNFSNTVGTVTLTAAADPSSTFTSWSGGCTGTSITCTVTMNAAKTVTATFALKSYALTVTRPGTGTGTVTSSPTGINCGATCSANFNWGTVVTLTAAAATGSTFTGWSGGGCSGTGSCVVTMNAATAVTATFTLNSYALTLTTTSGSGTGTVTSSPTGISCGATCTANFNWGTAVTLTATADSNSTFTGWSGGGCSGTGTCQVTVSAATAVTATFTLKSYALTVTKSGPGTNTVTSSPTGISCGATCTANFIWGTMVTLTATPDPASTFTGWGGACSGTGSCTVTVSAATSVSATFAATSYTISGTVFEDTSYPGGAGRSLGSSGGVGVSNARVELYDNTGKFSAFATTNSSGGYTFAITSPTAGTWLVRVVNSTVLSRGGLVPVQTYRTTVSGTTASDDTARVGGENPTVADAAQGSASATLNSTTGVFTAGITGQAQSITQVTIPASVTATVSGVNFGFSFDTIVNTNDSGQGSLRQFILNSNAMTTVTNSSNFMISDGNAHAGLRAGLTNQLTSGVAVISLASALPTMTASNTVLDGSTQATNIGNTNLAALGTSTTVGTSATTFPQFSGPEIEVQGNGTVGDTQLVLSGSGDQVLSMAFHQVGLSLQGANTKAAENIVGMHANGSISTALNLQGITIGSSSGILIHHNYVKCNNSAIRRDGSGGSATIEYNEVTVPPTGQTNTFDGILLVGPGTATNDTIQYNYVHNLVGGGLEFGFGGTMTLTGTTVSNNTFSGNGNNGASPSTEPVNIAIWQATLTGVTIKQNVVTSAGAIGVLVMAATGVKLSQNSIHTNGVSGTMGPGIQLDANAHDPNTYGTAPGPTGNSGSKNCSTLPNCGMNYPIFTVATLQGTTLRVKGYVGSAAGQSAFASATIELFKADNTPANQSGPIVAGDGLSVPHGEGTSYVTTITADASGNFDLTLTGVGVNVNDVLTATATDSSGNTSEFSPNITVVAGYSISGQLYVDANHNGAQDTGEDWTSGTSVYVNLVQSGAVSQSIQVAAGTGTFTFNNVPAGSYTLITANTATATTGAAPAGWVATSASGVSLAETVASANITGQLFGFFKGSSVSGTVFLDTGGGTATANDGIQQTGELGLAAASIKVTNSGGTTTYDSNTTNASGAFTLYIPSTATTVVLSRVADVNYLATGGAAGTTGGTYARATESANFTATAGTVYTGVFFGDVPVNTLSNTGASTILVGTSTYYSHKFVAGSAGSLTLATSAVSAPVQSGWVEAIYVDAACSGAWAAGDVLFSTVSPKAMTAGQWICLLVKETVPAAGTGTDTVTLTASYSYTNANPSLLSPLTRTDVTTAGANTNVTLQKAVNTSQALPGAVLTYTLTFQNIGAFAGTNVYLSDATPTYTTFVSATCGTPLPTGITACAVTTAPAVGGTGPVTWSLTGSLAPGASGTVQLQVTIQ